MLLEDLGDLFEDGRRLHFRTDVHVLLQLVVVLHDFAGLALVGLEPLLDALDVVVGPSAGLSALQQSLQHGLLAALQVQDEGDVHFFVHYLFPGAQVLDVSGEAVDQETSSFEAGLVHRVLQQHHGDLAGHDLTFNDVFLDGFSVL